DGVDLANGNRTASRDDEIGHKHRLTLKMARHVEADQARAKGIVAFILSAKEARLSPQNIGVFSEMLHLIKDARQESLRTAGVGQFRIVIRARRRLFQERQYPRK